MPRKGKGDISEEVQEILEDRDIWENETTPRGVIHDSRKRETVNEDGSFMIHRKGPITGIHVHSRLVSPGGEGTRVAGRMDEVDFG